MRKQLKSKEEDIYEDYRKVLGKPELTEKEIDGMRLNVQRLARAICEYVWKEKFY